MRLSAYYIDRVAAAAFNAYSDEMRNDERWDDIDEDEQECWRVVVRTVLEFDDRDEDEEEIENDDDDDASGCDEA